MTMYNLTSYTDNINVEGAILKQLYSALIETMACRMQVGNNL